MAGRTIRVMPRRRFTYTTGQLPQSAVVEFVVAERVDVTGYKTVELVGRQHAGTLAANQKFEILAVADAPTEEDPSQFFRSSAAQGNVTFTSTSVAPSLSFGPLTAPFGNMITITARVTQNAV